MIAGKNIETWLNKEISAEDNIFRLLGFPNPNSSEREANALKDAAAYKDKKTGDSFLHKVFTTGNYYSLIGELYLHDRNFINIDLLCMLHNMLNKLSVLDNKIINRLNNKGDTPLDSVLNLQHSITSKVMDTRYDSDDVKTNTSYIVQMLIYCGGYCKIGGGNKERNSFLYDTLHGKLQIEAMHTELHYQISPRFAPIIESVNPTLLAFNLLFNEDNVAALNLKRDLANLQIAVGYVKYGSMLKFIFLECMVRQVFSEHFATQLSEQDKKFYIVKPSCQILKLYEYCEILENDPKKELSTAEDKIEVDSNSEEKQGDTPSTENSSKKEKKIDKHCSDMMKLLHYLTVIPRCFTPDYSKIASDFAFEILRSDAVTQCTKDTMGNNQYAKALFLGENNRNAIKTIILLSIKNYNNVVLEILLNSMRILLKDALVQPSSLENVQFITKTMLSLITTSGDDMPHFLDMPEKNKDISITMHEALLHNLGYIVFYAFQLKNKEALTLLKNAKESLEEIRVQKYFEKKTQEQEQERSL